MQTPMPGLDVEDLFGQAPMWWFWDVLNWLDDSQWPKFDKNPIADFLSKLEALQEWQGFSEAVSQAADDFYELFDWSNPHSAKTILIRSLLTLLQGLAESSIKVTEAMLHIVLNFVDDCADLIVGWCRVDVPSPVIQTAYHFAQEQAGIPVEQRKNLCFGDAGILLSAYPATMLYKTIWGESPFPPGDEGDEGEGGSRALGGVITPPKWRSLKYYQSYCVAMMVADAPFDAYVTYSAIMKAAKVEDYVKVSKMFWVVFGFNHWIAYAVGDYPEFWGNDFPPKDWNDPSEWGPTVMWLMSAIVNTADVGVAVEYKAFIGAFEESPLAMNFYFIMGLGRTAISFMRYDHGDDKGFPFAIWNCAINVTSFESATFGWLRKPLDTSRPDFLSWVAVNVIHIAVDVVCDLFAGIASIVQIAYEDLNPPTFVTPGFPDGEVGESYEVILSGTNGMTPYSWDFVVPDHVPDGAIGGLPPGLKVNQLPTAADSVLTGEPTKAGTYVFQLRLTDDYGPGFVYLDDKVTTVTISK
jgi:hypothetical protein